MSHSPGPWKWGIGRGAYLQDADDRSIFAVGTGSIWNPQGYDLALIAAAPELLAMLRELEWVFHERAGVGACPSCHRVEDVGYGGGHESDCRLAALLARFPA